MTVLVIITKKEELLHVIVNPVCNWETAKGAEGKGLKVYVHSDDLGHYSEVGEYGWKHCPNPPDIVKMAKMLHD